MEKTVVKMETIDIGSFERTWLEIIDKLDRGVIDGRGAQQLYLSFDRDELRVRMGLPNTSIKAGEISRRIDLLRSRLTTAIEMAHSRFDLQYKKTLAKILISVFVPTISISIGIIIAILKL
jgi:hypothetical protein